MQRLVARQLGYAAGINHVSWIFLCKDGKSLFSDWWGDIRGIAQCRELLSNGIKAVGDLPLLAEQRFICTARSWALFFSLLVPKAAGQG